MSLLSTLTPLHLAPVALAVVLLLVLRSRQGKSSRPLPPGPPKRWIVGNGPDIPQPPHEWETFHRWGKEYGPVTHLRIFQVDILVLNNMKVINDLMDKRSAIYSDRPRMPMVGELCGYQWMVSIMRYGAYWRLHRRVLHQHLNEAASKRQWHVHERLNAIFLKNLMDKPEDWWSLSRWLPGANVLATTLGAVPQLKNDPFIQLGEDALTGSSRTGRIGAYLVDVLPQLTHVPSWFPLASFQKEANYYRKISTRAKKYPYAWFKEQMDAGKAKPSLATELQDTLIDGKHLPEDVMENIVSMTYLAGADTTVSALYAFYLGMARNTDVMRKAQAEVDRVVGNSRLPSFHDRASMPYVDAVLRETLRKYPVLPLGVPHGLLEEDEYEGMRMPKDSIVLANVWSILHDPEMYPDPHRFYPDRFLKDGKLRTDILDPHQPFFGFGRRICPGRFFADTEVWLLIATMLYCFDILPATDEKGNAIIPPESITSGITVFPKKFPCVMKLRSEDRRPLISEAYERAMATEF